MQLLYGDVPLKLPVPGQAVDPPSLQQLTFSPNAAVWPWDWCEGCRAVAAHSPHQHPRVRLLRLHPTPWTGGKAPASIRALDVQPQV